MVKQKAEPFSLTIWDQTRSLRFLDERRLEMVVTMVLSQSRVLRKIPTLRTLTLGIHGMDFEAI